MIAGCASTPEPARPAAAAPESLRLEEYFAGESRAWGVFRDRFGAVRRQFTVDITGDWDGRTLTLDERFQYSDGETERRVWTITPAGPNAYEGRAGDVRGTAEGIVSGSALRWRYDLDLSVNGRVWTVDFDDRMYLQPDGVLINHAVVRKFGVRIGEVLIVFQQGANGAAELTRAPAVSEALQ